jgi:hypothetical protein
MSADLDEIDFDIDAMNGSSGEAFSARPSEPPGAELFNEQEPDENVSPVFKLLSRPVLPELKRETRARLMMQSPTRLYFYWSIGKHSFQALNEIAGSGTDDYRLALRILDLTSETEAMHAVEPEGSWWFDVKPGTQYRAEIGFYSANRPFIRILFSNAISTPRKTPSSHSSAESRWAVTTSEFAEILDVSGFEEDAFDDISDASNIRDGFAKHIGLTEAEAFKLNENEVRRALGHLGAGLPMDDLRYTITAELFALLQTHFDKLTAAALLGFPEDREFETFPGVGGSLVNIPRRRYRPLSSIDVP